MSRVYGKVPSNLWENPRILGLHERSEHLLLYLYVCRHTNLIGCFHLRVAHIVADLRWDEPTTRMHLNGLEDAGFIEYAEPCGLLRLVEWWDVNTLENCGLAKAAVKSFQRLPPEPILLTAYDDLKAQLEAGQFTEKVRAYLLENLKAPRPRIPHPVARPPVTPDLFLNNSGIVQAESRARAEAEAEAKTGTEAEAEAEAAAAGAAPPADVAQLCPGFAEAIPRVLAALDNSPNIVNLNRLSTWLRNGCDLELDILPAIAEVLARKRRDEPGWLPNRLNFFDGAVADARATRLRPMPAGIASGRRRALTDEQIEWAILRGNPKHDHLSDDELRALTREASA